LVIPIIGSTEQPVYQRIAGKVLHLSGLGMSLSKIAEVLGVTDKTASKAVRFLKRGWVSSRKSPMES
jgi:hypothetical protein